MSSMKIPDRLIGYLEDLAALGYFGKTPGDVARHFIERGIERAVYDGFIEVQDWNSRAEAPVLLRGARGPKEEEEEE